MKTGKQNKYGKWTVARVGRLDELVDSFHNEPWTYIAKRLNYTMKTNFSRSAVYRAAEYYDIVFPRGPRIEETIENRGCRLV